MNWRLFATDNVWGIPSLRLDMQAERIEAPVLQWGSFPRTRRMPGTWTFYVDDYRFSALLGTPEGLLATQCACAVEPNVTVYEQSPPAEVLWATYRKRAVARTWQDAGVRVLVDLNVPQRYREIAMLGVPRGWRAFATRGYYARRDDLVAEHALASEYAHGEPVLLVCGGGAEVEALCRTLPGSVYVPGRGNGARQAAPPLPGPSR